MRLAALFCLVLATPVFAEEKTADCEAQMVVVSKAVDARVEGVRKGKIRRELRAEYGQTAADMLVEFVYGVPEEQIDEIKDAYQQACEAQ
ncbi:hypothetical protein [Pacificoceanicola onchidii]|uniref:hypothetical protein n=1 Tax=Pacificoceanicola onchidii TaxID=2562685 RepID=UPI0010A6AA8D|nr:hypothetical protein [Pacificoceanicola onchidii]